MAEVKKFFNKDIALDKGYGKNLKDKFYYKDFNARDLEDITQNPKSQHSEKTFFHNIMPPPEVLSMYEEIAPGALSKILDIAKQEQKNAHAEQIQALKRYQEVTKYGQFCALISVFLICITTIIIMLSAGEKHAIIFGGVAFISLVSITFFAYYYTSSSKNISKRKRKRY